MVTILGKVDSLGSSSEDIYAVLFEVVSKVERSLTAELCNNAERLFLFVDSKHVLKRKRLEVKLVRCIIVGRDRFRVAVYDNALKSKLFECKRCMNAAVVELDTLSDPVRAAAEYHYLGSVA